MSIAGFGPYCPQLCRRASQVFGTQHVSPLSKSRSHAVDSQCLRLPRARIPARKKMLKIISAVDIRWRLSLRSGVDQNPLATLSPSMFRMKSAHAFLRQERRYSGGVETSVSRRI